MSSQMAAASSSQYVAPAGLPRRFQNCSSPSRVSYKLTVKREYIIFDILSYNEPSQEYEAILDTEVDNNEEYSDPGILIHRLVYIFCRRSHNRCRIIRDGEELNESYPMSFNKQAAQDFRILCLHNELEYCSIICNTENNARSRKNLKEFFSELNEIKTPFKDLRRVRLNVLETGDLYCFLENSASLHTIYLVGVSQRVRGQILDMDLISLKTNWANVISLTAKNVLCTTAALNRFARNFTGFKTIDIKVRHISKQFIDAMENIMGPNRETLKFRFSSDTNINWDDFNEEIQMEIPGEDDFSGWCMVTVLDNGICRRVFSKAVEFSSIVDGE